MWVVVGKYHIFVARGWKRLDTYHQFKTPWLNHSPNHILCTPSEWVAEIMPLHAVLPVMLPLEIVHLIGEYA